MEIKLTNGKWVAIIKGKVKLYNNLNYFDKKLFSILFNIKLKNQIKYESSQITSRRLAGADK